MSAPRGREPTPRAWTRLERALRARRLNSAGGLGDRARTVLEGVVDRTARGVEIPAQAVFAAELGMGVDAFAAALRELLAAELVIRIQRGSRPSVYWPDFERVSAWASGELVIDALSSDFPTTNRGLTGENPDTNEGLSRENPETLARAASVPVVPEGVFAGVDEALVERVCGLLSWWKIPWSRGVRDECVRLWVERYGMEQIEYAIRETGKSRERSVRLLEAILLRLAADGLVAAEPEHGAGVIPLGQRRGGA